MIFPPVRPTAADVIVLAGDIDVGVAGVRWAAAEAERLGKEVVYVVGNHEYYNHDIGLLDELRLVAKDLHLVRLLENDEVVTGGVRFLGCTLWTDYRAAGGQPLARRNRSGTYHGFHFFAPDQGLSVKSSSPE